VSRIVVMKRAHVALMVGFQRFGVMFLHVCFRPGRAYLHLSRCCELVLELRREDVAEWRSWKPSARAALLRGTVLSRWPMCQMPWPR